MAVTARVGATVLSSLLVGCAIHPLPEDTTKVPTYLIVEKIRCEARDAVKQSLVAYLLNYSEDEYPDVHRLGEEFKSGAIPLSSFKDSLFPGGVKTTIQKYEKTGIAYDFTFDMSEINNIDATLDLDRPLKRFTSAFGFSAGIDRTRDNIRTFTITDNFLGLMTNVSDKYCEQSKSLKGSNYIYPISGNIGIDEMIHTFIYLSYFANLSNPDPAKPAGPPTLTDTLTFTTKISGSATPKIVFSPVGSALQLADASLVGVASRTDVHKVIVALALPVPASAKAESSGAKPKTGTLINVSADKTETEKEAAHAIEEFIIRFEVGKATTVTIANQ